MVVKLDADVLYWHEVTRSWTTSEYLASKFFKRSEADSKVILLSVAEPNLVGKLHVRDFYGNDTSGGEQLELF